MGTEPKTLLDYETENGECQIRDWLDSLDRNVRARVESRLKRIMLGNFGDVKSVGSGVSELRLPFGKGYRVYLAKFKDEIVLLLCGGDKSSQSKDTEKAKLYWRDFKRRWHDELRRWRIIL
ncbi:MAG: type II toxin-antitoxin system RelE/ParE family toxin [Pyrinomonadaceae bacterium]